MHLVIATAGSRGDVEPYLALGTRALAQGWRVTLITHACFQARVEAMGLGWRPLVGDPTAIIALPVARDWLRESSRRNEFRAMRAFTHTLRELYRQQLDDLLAGTTDADVVLYSPLCRAVAQLRERRDLPVVGGFLQPLTPTAEYPAAGLAWRAPRGRLDRIGNRISHQVGELLLWRIAQPAVNAWRRERLALPPLSWRGPYARERNARYPILYAFSQEVLPRPADWPAWVQQTGWWQLPAPTYQPPPALEAFLRGGAPPVVIGFGSMTPTDAEWMTHLALEAAERAEVRVLFLQGWGNLGATSLPAWAHVEPEVPHAWLLPQAVGVVHHGGAGTTGATARAGVPACIVPLGFDQQLWAHRMHALQAATAPLPRRQLTVEALTGRLQALVRDDALRTAAAALGDRVRREDGTGAALAHIEAHVRGRPID